MWVALLVVWVQEDWKLESKTSVVRREKDWTFRVEGTTNLPNGTILRARVWALEEVVDPDNGGTMWDEEALFYGDEAFQDAEVQDGKFTMDVYALRRKPFSLRYRTRALYDPDFQTDAVRRAVGNKKFDKAADFREGEEKTLAEELRASAKELNEDFLAVKDLYGELKREFTAHQEKYDSEKWKRWLDPWMDKVQALRARNDERWMLWAIWVERQGRLRMEGFCMRLPDLASDCREVLEGKKESLERAQLKMKMFLDYFEEAIEVVGLEIPLDVPTISSGLEEYLRQVEALRKGGARAAIRRAASEALLKIAGAFQRRKKGYYRVNQIMSRFVELVRTEDPEQFRKILEEHDREVREFKRYAGIK